MSFLCHLSYWSTIDKKVLLLIRTKLYQFRFSIGDYKMQVVESTLVGEFVTVTCLDRNESEYDGELLELSALGAVVKYSSHGRDFFEYIPQSNIHSISHKVVDSE
jgi:hypothetical protein